MIKEKIDPMFISLKVEHELDKMFHNCERHTIPCDQGEYLNQSFDVSCLRMQLRWSYGNQNRIICGVHVMFLGTDPVAAEDRIELTPDKIGNTEAEIKAYNTSVAKAIIRVMQRMYSSTH